MAVADELATSNVGCEMVIEVVLVHPFASVTVKTWVPAGRLNWPVPEYGAVPPLAETVTVEEPPLHKMEVADEVATN